MEGGTCLVSALKYWLYEWKSQLLMEDAAEEVGGYGGLDRVLLVEVGPMTGTGLGLEYVLYKWKSWV